MLQYCPYGPMDKAPAYGAGDSGFESQYGLTFFAWKTKIIDVPPGAHIERGLTPSFLAMLQHMTKKNKKKRKKRGDARIELATSCTRSRNHTTRPITQVCWKKRDVLELNQRPIGLQPIALPLS